MKHCRRLRIILALLLPALLSAAMIRPAAADTVSVTQELHVTARVPDMRHIIISPAGRIMRITSNTTADVTPEVYVRTDAPANRVPLTPQIYAAFRQYVPFGSEARGILYEGGLTAIIGRGESFHEHFTDTLGTITQAQNNRGQISLLTEF